MNAVVAKLTDTFAALRYPNYRLWFIGQLTSLVGTWMQNTAQSYLIYKLTGSSAYVGYVGLATGLPSWFFMLYGGVIVDRTSRRSVLLVTQVVMMLLALILAGLVFLDEVQPWHIIVLAFLLGVANAFDAPARLAFVNELVDHTDLTNAIALNATMFNVAIIFGPMVAAETYDRFGPAWCFLINSISFLAVIAALLMMRIKPAPSRPIKAAAIYEIVQGVKYAVSEHTIGIIVMSVGIATLFGLSTNTLMPAWSEQVLGGDERTYGSLLTARGIGAVIAALLLASMGQRRWRGKLWMIGNLIYPVLLLVFAFVRWLPLSFVIAICMGWGWISFVNTSNAIVQSLVSDEFRGRVMSIYALVFFGSMTIGSPLAGELATAIGEQKAIILTSSILLAYVLFIFFRRADLRRLA